VIFVAADHTESWSTAETASGTTTTGCCADKNGIKIIGLGTGDRRPTFTFTAAAGTLYVDATEVTIYNLIFYSNFANHASHIDAQSGADGLVVEGCKFYDASAITETVSGIIITANCDDVTIRGNKFYNVDTNDGSDEAILLEGGSDRIRIIDNVFDGDWNEEVINMNTAASTEIEIVGNYCNNVDAGFSCFIATHSSCTGVIADNTVYCPAAGSAGGVIADTVCLRANNRITTDLTVEGGDATVDTSGLHQVYYLDSGTGTDTNDGKTWSTAFATIGAAIDACTANNGDIIYVAANHAQTLTGAGTATEMDVDCDGISIIGLGNGNDRPTFTMDTDTANATCYVTGEDCKLENLRFVCAEASLEQLVDVNGDGLQLINCEFTDDGTDEPLACVKIDTGDGVGDRLLIKDCKFDVVTGDTDWGVYFNKDIADATITGCEFIGEYDVACVFLDTAANASTNLTITNNVFENIASGIPLVLITGAAVTGRIMGNTFISDTRDEVCSPSLTVMAQNQWLDSAGTGGATVPENNPSITAEVFFVDSGADDAADAVGLGKSWDQPFATIDYAIAYCTADQGAEIHVAPGHAESLAGAADIAVDVAGISIIGHGQGPNLPTLTVATDNNEAAPVLISAAGCTLKNIRFLGGKAGGSQDALEISGDDTTIDGCIFYESVNTSELAVADNYGIITIMDAGASVERTTIKNCLFLGASGGNDESAISVTDASNGATFTHIINCYIIGTYSDSAIQMDQGANVNTLSWIKDTTIINDAAAGGAGACIAIDAAAVWVIDGCSICSADVDAEPISDDAASYLVNTHTCEKGAYSSDAVQGSVTNWGA
jgi:hypothetical protein